MITKIKNLWTTLESIEIKHKASMSYFKKIDNIAINQARQMVDYNLRYKLQDILHDIKKSEFKVFSQWGDDGIINFLVNYLDIESKTFVEFGVENYTECNTRLLLHLENWKGLILDGSKSNIDYIKKDDIYWKFNISVLEKFITAENINDILTETGFTGEVGLFHIDIDGNDYWIWKALNVVSPVIMIVEYNSLFGWERPITTPYAPDFFRTQAHFSNVYYGTSLASICDLANERGYSFIGCNSNGNNAYFVRNDKIKELRVKSTEEGFVLSQFSEVRNLQGRLTFEREEARCDAIRGLTVYNTKTNQLEKF